MDGDEMHVLGQALYRGCYLPSQRNMLPIMAAEICYMTWGVIVRSDIQL